jgi:SAM-dependent methyltransferase
VAGWNSRPKEFKQLWGYSVGFYGVWVAHIGRRTGLFEAIAERLLSSDELADRKGFDKGAVKAWCSAADSLGFLKTRGKKFYMPTYMRAILLDKKNPLYLGGQFSYIALRSSEYGALEDLVRNGKTRAMISSFEAIVEATEWDHNAFLSAIKHGKLHKMLSKGCNVLDVGCGTGTFIEKMLREYPHSSFTGIEPSDAVHKAMAMAACRPVEILRQKGEDMSFENKFELVYLGESLYAAIDKQAIVSNSFTALKKKGSIAIVEGLMPEKVDDEGRLIMGMQLDFALQGYRFMTRKEIASLLKHAGFTRTSFSDLGGSLYLVMAQKP